MAALGVVLCCAVLAAFVVPEIQKIQQKNTARLMYSFWLADMPDATDAQLSQQVQDMRKMLDQVSTTIDSLQAEGSGLNMDELWVEALFYVRYNTRRPPAGHSLESDIALLAAGGTPKWLRENINRKAETIYAALQTALYCGVPSETHRMVQEALREDGAAFAGGDFCAPVADWHSVISSEYGARSNPTSALGEQHIHNGIDLAPAAGSDIFAAQGGVVLLVMRSDTGYGNHVVINHGEQIATLYAHCESIYVREGQRVELGQRIATVGSSGNSTGPHVHFEVIEDGQPVNPRKYLR